MPRRNKNADGKRGKFANTDANYGYGTPPALTRNCPVDDCLASFAADTQADVEGAVQDHLENAHDQDQA